MSRNLPHHSIGLTAGLLTNFVEEKVSKVGLVTAQNVDMFDAFLGLGKVSGSRVVSPSLGSAVKSLHQFEFTDLDYVRKRHQLALYAAGGNGVLDRINDPLGSPSRTELFNSATLLAERLQKAIMLDRLHLSSENQYALPTGGIKYDGTRVTNWGLLAPGQAVAVVENFDSAASWTAGAQSSISTNTTSKQDLIASVQLNKTGTGSTNCSLSRSGLAHNLSAAGEDLLFLWAFIPSGVLQKLDTNAAPASARTALNIILTNGAATAEYRVTLGSLLSGWNLVSMVLTSPDATTGGWVEANLSAVSAIEIILLASAAGNTWTGALVDRMYIVDEGRPSVAASGSAGVLAGSEHSYRITFVSDVGHESNAGPVSSSVSPDAAYATGTLAFAAQPANDDVVTIGSITYTFKTTLSGKDAAYYEVLRGADATAARDNFVKAINDSGSANANLNFTGTPADGNIVTIGSVSYTFKTALSASPVVREVLIGGSATNSRNNLRKAINANGVSNTDYAGIVAAHSQVSAADGVAGTSLDVTARTAGITQQSIAVSETGANTAWDSATLLVDEYRGVVSAHTQVGAAASGSDMLVTADTAGTAGNAIATTETSANLSWGAATLTGGLAGGQVALTAVPVSADTQVVARRIYRDKDGDNIFRFVGETANNTTTTFADNVPDASLGDEPPIAGDDIIDHSPPGRMKDFVAHEGRIYGILAESSNTVAISDVGNPEAFRIVDRLVVEEDLVAIEEHPVGLLLFSTDKLYLLTGDGINTPFRTDLVSTQVGANNANCVAKVKSLVLAMREYDVYLVTDPRDPWQINSGVLDLFRLIDRTKLDNVHVVHDRARYRILFFGQSATGGGAYDLCYIYQYGTTGFQQITGDGGGSDPQDLRVGSWYTALLPSAYGPHCSEEVEVEGDEIPQAWVGGNDGYVYRLSDSSVLTGWAIGGGAAVAIDSIIESAAVPLGYPEGLGRGQPRYVRLNVKHGGTAGTITVEVATYSGPGDRTALDTESISVSLPAGTGDSTLIVPVPMMSRGEWARVKIRHNATGLAGVLQIADLSMLYVPRAFRGQQTA